ncbi:MAG: bifunctional 4-hydroxy-2-oxoglutarate aldolase/2-dehydro-3-deoxy-phosphogluconate aldolase [Bacteroidota bacterium]
MNIFSQAKFEQIPIVGIIRGITKDKAQTVFDLYEKVGFSTIEITMNTEGACEMIAHLVSSFAGRLNVGAGTVRTMEELDEALQAGAKFIVTPIVNQGVIEKCAAKSIPIFVGAYTPTEIFQAWQWGATAVKIFPTITGGTTHIKAVKAPLEMIPLIPTGGVTAENIADYFELGIYGVGMGGQLFPKSRIEQEDWKGLEEQLRKVKNAYLQWKNK